ncbi:flagellar motor switch protein FliM [Microbacterium sp. p3-SID336]|uniref:flagellar motor switch protein FliM n=1 Tax=Microbacterium sp. p3-SID336 TaxID=2916212 RepID=UPI0021A6745A|nr:flagellar motor switch protein FliM [Microbacterium sp. p3-SID336]MCT1477827.1 flagellar motor switch protein FliM [Microbacterium sp. p3-SID336]
MDDGVRSSARAQTATATAEVEVYDFGRAATLSREHARTLELAFETFARQWSAQLSGKIHVRATIAVEHVGMLTYGEYAQSLPTTTSMIVCALPDSDERMIVQVPTSTATSWIVQMVGGRSAASTAEDRTFTPIEQALLRSLVTDATEHLAAALDGLLPSGITVAGIQYSSQFAQVAAAGEPVIVARLSLRHGGRTVPASIMLPASVLAGFAVRAADTDRAATPGLVRRQVESAPVEVALRLAPRTVLPREVLDLAVGDLLALPHSADRPLLLAVGDQTVATAAVGSAGARLACVVTATVPETAPAAQESA